MRIFHGSAVEAIDRALAYPDHRILFVGGTRAHVETVVADALGQPQYAHLTPRSAPGRSRNVFELADRHSGRLLGTLWITTAARIDHMRGLRFGTVVIADGVSITEAERGHLHMLLEPLRATVPEQFAARMRAKRAGEAIG